MNVTYVILMALVSGMLTLALAGRKPKFDIPDERENGANLHWFSLKQDAEAELRIKQIYFDVGEAFLTAGWRIPNGVADRLICLVILESQITTVNNRGEQTWAMALMTQGPVGDLYRECWRAVESKAMKYIAKKDLIQSPLSPNVKDIANVTISEMDCFEPTGSHHPVAVIRHEAHPTNPARSMYVLSGNRMNWA